MFTDAMLVLNNNANFKLLEAAENAAENRYDYFYECDFNVALEDGSVVNVSGLNIFNTYWTVSGSTSTELHLTHDTDYVYGSRAFEAAVSELLGVAVQFTESGMQDENFASMELA